MKIKPMIPNTITAFRIIATFCLLFTKPFSKCFYAIYTLAGFSDAIDGFIARKTNTISEFGTKLDSVADMIYYTVTLLMIIPVVNSRISSGIWCAVGAGVAVRLCAYAVAAVKYRRFASLHTYMNKITGFAVFILPYTVNTQTFEIWCYAVCIISILSSTEELFIHLFYNEYSNKKTIIK